MKLWLQQGVLNWCGEIESIAVTHPDLWPMCWTLPWFDDLDVFFFLTGRVRQGVLVGEKMVKFPFLVFFLFPNTIKILPFFSLFRGLLHALRPLPLWFYIRQRVDRNERLKEQVAFVLIYLHSVVLFSTRNSCSFFCVVLLSIINHFGHG